MNTFISYQISVDKYIVLFTADPKQETRGNAAIETSPLSGPCIKHCFQRILSAPIMSKKDMNNMSFKEFKNIKGI